MEEELKSVIDLLLTLTKDGSIEWKYGSTENAFKVELNSAIIVITFFNSDLIAGKNDVYELTMFNGTGKAVELASLGVEDDNPDYQLLKQLFCVARESTSKKRETLSHVLKELKEIDQSRLPF